MSKSSEAVKEWRRNTKLKLIICMGSKCQLCDYNKSQNALEFHHVDPSMKDFSLSQVRANPKNWGTITKELRKCILLCSNCHKEVHEGISFLPKTYQEFNESLLQLDSNKHLLKETKTSYCPVCSKEKENKLKTCSVECAAKHRIKFDWDSIDLIDLKENQKLTNVAIAELVGCSDALIHKKYKKIKQRSTN